MLDYSAHSFWRSLRKTDLLKDRDAVISRLLDNRTRLESEVNRWGIVAVILVLWLIGGKAKDLLEVDQLGLHLSVPRLLVVFVSSLCLGLSVLSFVSLVVVSRAIDRIVEQKLKVDEAVTLSPLFNAPSAWLLPLAEEFRFFNSGGIHKVLRGWTAVLVLLSLLAVYSYMALVVSVEAIDNFFWENSWSVWGLSGLVILILVSQFLLFLAMLVPISFTRNTKFVRWNFLAIAVYKRRSHPQERRWLDQEK